MAASRPFLVAMATDVPHFFGDEAVVPDFCTLLRVSRCAFLRDLFRFCQIFKVAHFKFLVAAPSTRLVLHLYGNGSKAKDLRK
jgi:hypothetical protein